MRFWETIVRFAVSRMPSFMISSTTPFHCVIKAWHAHERELRIFLRHQLSSAEAGDDLLQEVFIKAVQQGAGFCQLDNSRAWLFQVARHLITDRYRRQTHENWVSLPENLPAQAPEVEPVAAMSQCIARVLSELSVVESEIIEQCDLREVKQADFARQHGLSLAAVKSRLRRARLRLREKLLVSCQVRLDEDGHVVDFVPR